VAIGPHLSERDGRGEADPGPPPLLRQVCTYTGMSRAQA
jgi:hypothetical protein